MSDEERSSGSGFVIVRARPEDLPQIIRLNRAALPENYSSEFFEDMLKRYGEFFYVARTCEGLIGYVMCRVEFPSNAHIISVAVHPGHRRIGLATALMVAAHTAMIKMGLQRSHLEVRVSNAPAIALYEKLGYRKARVISSYYADGTDGILMELSLRPAGPNGAP